MKLNDQLFNGQDEKLLFMTKPWYAFGYKIPIIQSNGEVEIHSVFNERVVRATAGLMLVAGAIAFAFASLANIYYPMRVVSIVMFFDFVIRVTMGITPLSPFGVLASWLVRKQKPEWVASAPKRLAWSMGIVMSGTVASLTNLGLNGTLPMTLCLICLALMWMEAALGVCLGCKFYGLLVKWKIIGSSGGAAGCAGGTCYVSAIDK